VEIGVEFVARFADEDDAGDVEGADELVEFGEVLVVGLVAAAENEDDAVIWEGIDGDFGGAKVGGEVVVVVFDAV